jgi:hypothetical protein
MPIAMTYPPRVAQAYAKPVDPERGSRREIPLLAGLRPDGENLWAVGDSKQSVYRFRGASSFNMTRFDTEDFRPDEMAVTPANFVALISSPSLVPVAIETEQKATQQAYICSTPCHFGLSPLRGSHAGFAPERLNKRKTDTANN